MTKSPLRSIAWLRRNGLTLAEIAELSEAEILAFEIAFGEIEGGEWNWREMAWNKRDS